MDFILKRIKFIKNNLSQSSLKAYASIIFRLYKSFYDTKEVPNNFKFDFLNNHKKIIDIIDNKKSLNTQKLIYTTLVSMGKGLDIKKDVIQIYYDKMIFLRDEFEKDLNSQKKSEKQKMNWITYKELYDTYKHYRKLITVFKIRKKNKLNSTEFRVLLKFIILSLFLSEPKENPPRRAADYSNMVVVKSIPDDKDNNYIVKKNSRNKTFIFNKYKTFKTYGTQVFKVARRLNNDLNLWFKFSESKKYLLYNPQSPNKPLGTNNLTKILTDVFKKRFNKNISVNMIRSITLTDIYKDMPQLKTLDEIASKMGHSVSIALQNYVKKD